MKLPPVFSHQHAQAHPHERTPIFGWRRPQGTTSARRALWEVDWLDREQRRIEAGVHGAEERIKRRAWLAAVRCLWGCL